MNTNTSELTRWSEPLRIHERMRLFIHKQIKERVQFPSLVFEEESWNALVSTHLWCFFRPSPIYLFSVASATTVRILADESLPMFKDYLKISLMENPRRDDTLELARKALPVLFPQFKTNPDYVVTREDINDIKESLERDGFMIQRREKEDRSRCMFQRDINNFPEFTKRLGVLDRCVIAIRDLLVIVQILIHLHISPIPTLILECKHLMDLGLFRSFISFRSHEI